MIRIGGREVPLSAVAELVRRMNGRDEARLAITLGRAIDGGKNELTLTKRDYEQLLVAIERHAVDGLEPLLAAHRATTDGQPTDGQPDGTPRNRGAPAPDVLAPSV